LSTLQQRRASFARRLTAIGCITATAVALGAATPANAATPKPSPKPSSQNQASALAQLGISISADGWITYGHLKASSLSLTNTRTNTVKESRNAAGQCVISGKTDRGKKATYSEQIAFNPTTCESKVLTGDLTADEFNALVAKSGAAFPKSEKAPVAGHQSTGPAGQGKRPQDYYYDDAYTVSEWIDPLDITITEQAVDFEWPLYGEAGYLYAGWPSYEFPYDGWATDGPYFDGFYYYSDGYGDEANSHFINNDFAAIIYALMGLSGWLACGAHTTTQADFYHDLGVDGYDDDTAYGWWNDSVGGACSNLVHHWAAVGYGWL